MAQHTSTLQAQPAPGPATVFSMATACAFAVATIYYSQPLLPQMAAGLPALAGHAGLIATLTQVGYALGLLLFVPLGDVRDPRRVVLGLVMLNLLALLGCAAAPNAPALLLASALVGATAVSAQLIIPALSGLATPAQRGQVVGTLLSGLSAGLLFARTLSGIVGEHWGWRAMYELAALLDLGLAATVWRLMPALPRAGGPSYGTLLASLARLWRTEPVLRLSALTGLLLFAGFSALWTALATLLAQAPYHYGPARAGSFGLIGLAGLLASPLIGRLADRLGAQRLVLGGTAIVALAFALLYGGATHLAGLVGAMLLLDLGNRAGLVANQTRIYAARPEARSRMNTVFMTAYFTGGATGAALGGNVAQAAGWHGLAALGVGLALLAGALNLWAPAARPAPRPQCA
ncbi:MAG: MFS transporter [Roseateles sp.]|nr:MAG: MFS transporter [Roseateles sp.]